MNSAEQNYWPILLPVGAIAVVAALAYGASVFAPLALALFIIALVWPMQKRVQSVMPRSLALILSSLVIITVFIALAWLTTWAAGRVTRWMIADSARFQLLYEQIVAWLEGHGIAVASIWSEHFNVGWMLRMMQGVTGRLNSTVTFWLIVFVYVILGLLEVGEFERRIAALPNKQAAGRILAGANAAASKIRRYMLVRTAMSALTGILVWLFTLACGLDLSLEWGAIAFALNFIPVIGSLIATMFPTAFAVVQTGSWEWVAVVFLGLNAIQFAVGNYIEPRLSGSALAISPLAVLFAVFFWAFVWGIFGAFIGVPILITVMAICAQFPSSNWVSTILGSGKATAEY